MNPTTPVLHSFLVRTLFFAALFPTPAFAQVSIALPSSTSGSLWFYNSSTSTRSYLQTFVTPDAINTRMDSFQFLMQRCSLPTDFAAYLVKWNSSSNALSGAPLWSSAVQSSFTLGSSYAAATFTTGGIDLQPGQAYALAFFATNVGSGDVHVGTSSAYADGSAFQLTRSSSSASFADLYTATASGLGYDLAFGATFSAPALTAVPEPATAIAGLGFAFVAILVAFRLRQRRRNAASIAPV